MSAEIEALDWRINQQLRIAEAHESMRDHFAETAAEARAKAAEYLEERNRFLGRVGLENVVALPSGEIGDTVA